MHNSQKGARRIAVPGGDFAAIARVLVVEDNMIIAIDTEEKLYEHGVREVVVVGTVAHALAAIAGHGFDLALLDYNLGDETSVAVAERLSDRAIPLWIITGYGDDIDPETVIRANGVIAKPLSGKRLAGILDEVRGR